MWKPRMPRDVDAEIVAAGAAGLAMPAGLGAEDRHDCSPALQVVHAFAERGDRPRRLDADDDRQLALGEGHAPPAPDIDVVERDRADR